MWYYLVNFPSQLAFAVPEINFQNNDVWYHSNQMITVTKLGHGNSVKDII